MDVDSGSNWGALVGEAAAPPVVVAVEVSVAAARGEAAVASSVACEVVALGGDATSHAGARQALHAPHAPFHKHFSSHGVELPSHQPQHASRCRASAWQLENRTCAELTPTTPAPERKSRA